MSVVERNIDTAIEHVKAGKAVIMVDDEDRENEGDIVVATECLTPELLQFMEQKARGLTCVTLSQKQAERLQLPLQAVNNNAPFQTAFTMSVDKRSEIGRAQTVASRVKSMQALAAPHSVASDFVSPGHVYPLIAHKQGTIGRQGQTEGSHDLARIAGFQPSGIICEILNEDGSMARGESLEAFAKEYALPIVSVADILRYRINHEILLKEVSSSLRMTDFGEFTVHVIADEVDRKEHFVLRYGEPCPHKPVLVRIHSECLTGDVLGSRRCDCGGQLEKAISEVKKEGAGYILYLRQEGRGIGLLNKMRAYELQDQGHDTVQANVELGFDADKRDFAVAAKILQMFSVQKVRLMTNNPEKLSVLESFDIDVCERVPLVTNIDPFAVAYLETKKEKMGHLL